MVGGIEMLLTIIGETLDFDNAFQKVAKVNIVYNKYKEYAEIDINQYRFSLIL